MSKRKKPVVNLMSVTLPSENGLQPEKLTLSESQTEAVDSTMSKDSSQVELRKRNLKKNVISIVESRALLKKPISKDKLVISKKSIQTTKLSKTLPVESISKEKDSTKSWLIHSKDLSKKSWLPTETGCVGSHMTTSTGCLKSSEQISLLKINRNIVQSPSLAKICSLSSMYSPHDTTVLGGHTQLEKLKKIQIKNLKKQATTENTKILKKDPKSKHDKKEITENDLGDYIISAKRMKIIPLNNESKRNINDAIATSRKIWNRCVEEVQKNKDVTYTQLRDKLVTEKNMKEKEKQELSWTFRIAQKVREAVVRKFSANYATAQKNFEYNTKYYYKIKKKSNKKIKKKKKITMRFREKDAEKQVIYLNKEICKFRVCSETNKTILQTFNGVELVLQESYKNFNKTTTCETCQYIASSESALKTHMKRKNPCKKVSADSVPNAGLPHAEMILQRVGYDYYIYVPEYKPSILKLEAKNDVVALDAGWNTLLTYYSPDGEWGEICPGIKDKILSLRKMINSIEKKKLSRKSKNKAVKKRTKCIYNMVDDLQWKICHWLLSKYRKIIISRLYVAKTNKQGKQIQADLRLCGFVDRLVQKSIEYKNSEIHVGKEHHTSQACTKCLSLNTVKGTTVKCNGCNHEIHRDLNGARNIFLKHCY